MRAHHSKQDQGQVLTKATTIKIAASLLVGISVSLGAAYRHGVGNEPIGSNLAVEDRVPLERRLSELETSLALERYERQALADELDSLRDSMSELPARTFGDDQEPRSEPWERLATASGEGDGNEPLADQIRERLPDGRPMSHEALEQFIAQQQFDRFVAAGLAPHRAQAIMQREAELEMEVLRARHAATQSGATPQEVANITPLVLLRSELGNTEYAQYLDARGRRTSISVREVLRNSPAEIAGLKPGDEIMTYNGQRAIDLNELTALSYEAESGTPVPLELIRDGQPIQIYVEAGPLGIRAGGGSSRP
jgi:hypothetical protein